MATGQFGRLLRDFRKKKGLIQVELAEKAKLNQSTLSQFEGGKNPSKDSVRQIADALDLNAVQSDQLLMAAGYAPEYEPDFYNPALRSIAAVLQEPTTREVLKPLCEQLMQDFSESWQSFARGKQFQYGRDWRKSVEQCEGAGTKLASAVTLIPAYILDTMGTAKLHLGHWPEADRLYSEAAGLVSQRDFPDPYIRGLVYTHQGDLYRSQSAWDNALRSYEHALQVFKDNSKETDMARIQRKMGLVYLKMGQWPEAATYLDDSLKFFDRLVEHLSENSLASYELAKTYMAQGWVHSLKGEWDITLDIRQRALDIARDFRIPGQNKEDRYLLMQGHLYYGYDCGMVGNLDGAYEHLMDALKISKPLEDQQEHGLILLGLARLYFRKGHDDWEKAEKYFAQALEEHEKRGDKFRYAVTLNHWSSLLLGQGKPGQALNVLLDARERFRDLNNDYYLGESAVHLCEAHYQLRNFCKAGDLAAEEIEKIEVQKFPHFQHLSRLRAVKARSALAQDSIDEALVGYARSLMDSVRFNRYYCRLITSEIVRGMDIVIVRLGRKEAAEACQQLLDLFEKEVHSTQEKGLVYSQQQNKDVADLVAWLTEVFPRAIREGEPKPPPFL